MKKIVNWLISCTGYALLVGAAAGSTYALYTMVTMLISIVSEQKFPGLLTFAMPVLILAATLVPFKIGKIVIRAGMSEEERYEHEANVAELHNATSNALLRGASSVLGHKQRQ